MTTPVDMTAKMREISQGLPFKCAKGNQLLMIKGESIFPRDDPHNWLLSLTGFLFP